MVDRPNLGFEKPLCSKGHHNNFHDRTRTEEEFIKPVLELLGFKYISQVITREKGRSQPPDYALFSNTETRDIAYTLQSNETAFYGQVLAIAEAKYWERQVSKVSANDQRDIFKNENPSFQIFSYLTGTNVDWGILTNGREWRLYYRLGSSTATEFYPIDLVGLIDEIVYKLYGLTEEVKAIIEGENR